jgi:hypothetical protein
MSDIQLSRLVHVLGNAFVTSCLGLSESELQRGMLDDSPDDLGSGRSAACEMLGTIADRVEMERDVPLSIRLSEIAEKLAAWRPTVGKTYVGAIRDVAGVPQPEIDTQDPVAEPLCEIARDVAPVFALWEADDGGVSDVEVELGMERHGAAAGAIPDHPSHDRALAALGADPQLSKLLSPPAFHIPGDSTGLAGLGIDPDRFVYVGTPLHTALLIPGGDDGVVTALIHGAYDDVRVTGAAGPEALIDALPAHVARLRVALDGGPYRATVLAGIANLVLPPDLTIETPWGALRPYRQADSDFVPKSGPRGCVLQFELDTTLEVRLGHFTSTDGTLRREADARARMVGLAVLLAQKDPETTLGTFRSWIASPHPTQLPTFVWPPTLNDRYWRPTGEDLDRLRKAIETVRDVHHPSADIAVARCLRALAERDDPVDAMIDAVIVWENLFGSGTELSFRISSAMAMLLASDATERIALQKELKDLYTARSEVVHGAPVPAKKLTRERSDRAVELAAMALRKVYTEYPDLLALKTPERSAHLLFGAIDR